MKTVGEEQLLAFLKARRRTLVQAVVDRSRAYDDRDVRKLAELQGAISSAQSVAAGAIRFIILLACDWRGSSARPRRCRTYWAGSGRVAASRR